MTSTLLAGIPLLRCAICLSALTRDQHSSMRCNTFLLNTLPTLKIKLHSGTWIIVLFIVPAVLPLVVPWVVPHIVGGCIAVMHFIKPIRKVGFAHKAILVE